jgi:formate dehydrogenase subunit gamma
LTVQDRQTSEQEIVRFSVIERQLHWVTSLAVLILMATGAILYFPALSTRIGQRLLIENIHTYTGFFVLVPLVASLLGPWGRSVRADVNRLTKFEDREWAWFRPSRHRHVELGKFNPGQKLNAVLVTAGLSVLLLTGYALRFPGAFSVDIRMGVTFVHDWFAFAVAVLVFGHIAFALTHPQAMRSMIRGVVKRDWAERHAPRWLREYLDREPSA